MSQPFFLKWELKYQDAVRARGDLGRTVVSMDGNPVFDQVSDMIFRYGDPGDDSLDLQINCVLAIYGLSISEQVSMRAAGFHSKFPKNGDDGCLTS